MTSDMAIIRLSYIVPVYNTSDWLVECMDSMLKHEGDDIEFVIIDDGSTDGSGQIVDRYAESDRRIRVVHQSNGGLSVARNVGMENARGEYILFVDSDDRIEAQSVSNMLDKAVKEAADIVVGRILCQNESGNITPWGRFLPPSVFPSGFDFMQAINCTAAYFPMVFGYLIRRNLIQNHSLKFVPRLIHEDELWTPQVLTRAKMIVVSDKCHYIYRTNRDGSIMSSKYSVEQGLSIAKIIHALIDDCDFLLDRYNLSSSKFLPFFIRQITSLVIMLKEIETNGDIKMLKSNTTEYYFKFILRLKNDMIDNGSIMEYLHKCFDRN